MQVKTRLIMLAAIGIVGVFLTTAIGYFNAKRDKDAMHDIYLNRLISISHLLKFETAMTEISRRDYQISAFALIPYERQIDEIEGALQRHDAAFKQMRESRAAYGELPLEDEAITVWDDFKKTSESWLEIETKIVSYTRDRLKNPTPESLGEMFARNLKVNLDRRDLTQKLSDTIGILSSIDFKAAQRNYEESIASTENMMYIEFVALIFVVITLGGFAWSIYMSVVKPIGRARDIVVQVATEQDLKLRVNHRSKDEIGEMVAAFDRMMEKIQGSILAIKKSVEDVDKEVVTLNDAAEIVAQGSQAQSSATSSMAASVEEMSVSISSVSNNASDAQKMAGEAGEVSVQGSAVIEKTANEMGAMVEIVTQTSQVIQALGEESRQISSVVQVIKDVADQTNLLALNAAIEAARAGDQGRGFAVVADEVRKLAERTAKSIDDITSMINKIQASANEAVEEMDKVVRQVEQGQKLTQEAGEKMHTIKEQASRVSKAIDEISNALKEQSLAGQDIAKNVENIAQMTDKNNEAAAGASDGAKRLGKLSSDVSATLSQFKS
ncbi:MAG: methyl-accepting chemotaxis protein [Helicobacteraceae bacterium]|jgi:methyl-accepting chemotaxis protein|nr:methyl-accepting chemotaxis protein [Helicobacteraceae bacterium]